MEDITSHGAHIARQHQIAGVLKAANVDLDLSHGVETNGRIVVDTPEIIARRLLQTGALGGAVAIELQAAGVEV